MQDVCRTFQADADTKVDALQESLQPEKKHQIKKLLEQELANQNKSRQA